MALSSSEELTLGELLKLSVESSLMDVHVGVPGKVLSYDPDSNTAQVEIGVRRTYFGENPTAYPPLVDVPVRRPRSAGGKALIKLPVKKGDTGFIQFSERSISEWMASRDTSDPDSDRKFDLSDATFSPDLTQDYLASVSGDDSLEMSYDKMGIVLWPDGKVEIKGATEDFVKLFIEFIDKMIQAKVITGIGPQPFTVDTILALNVLKSRAETLAK